MGLPKFNLIALQRAAFSISLTLVVFAWHVELLHAQRAPRFRGPPPRSKQSFKTEFDKLHHKYFTKIDVAAAQYEQSLSDEAKSPANKAWQDFMALPKTIRKLKISIDRNTNWSGSVSLLTNRDAANSIIEISNTYVCERLMSDLSAMPRAPDDAPHACKFGTIKICFDDPADPTQPREFEIGISDGAFSLGDGPSGVARTSFYSWSLARVLSEAVKEQNNYLTQLSFNILSGFNSISSPVKFNARSASSKLRNYWAQPADVWFTIPSSLRTRGYYQKHKSLSDSDNNRLAVWIDVKTPSDPSGEFYWFNEGHLTEFSSRPMYTSESFNAALMGARFNYGGPIDVQQIKIMGVINLNVMNFSDIDIFVTDKGFLTQFQSQYHLFHSYDLAVWLDTIAKTRRSCISQKAFNVLSGIDDIVSKQQSFLDLDSKPYNIDPARTQFVAPRQFTSNDQANAK